MNAPVDVLAVMLRAAAGREWDRDRAQSNNDEATAEFAERERVALIEARAAVAELIEVAKFAELLKFKQSVSNPNAAFLDYRDCVHLQTIASAALARVQP